jgi:ABC-type dipeptide/oligopeptide/nickel transport system permease subunit
VLGAALGALMRTATLGRISSALSAPMAALAGPALAVTMAYWFQVRFDVGLGAGAEPFGDDPSGATSRLILPAAYLGITLAPSLATLVASRGPYLEPFGMAAAASGLASRCEERRSWRFGFPAGLLATGLLVAELVFGRPGLFGTVVQSVAAGDERAALDALGVIVLAGAGIAVVVDLVGLRMNEPATPTPASLRLAGYPSPRSWMYWAASLAISIVVLLATIAGQLADASAIAPDDRLLGPLSGGHPLGTDTLGRDLLSLALAGLQPALIAALVPGCAALLGGIGVEALRRGLGPTGDLVPGALVDVLWWPLPILAVFAALATSGQDLGLVHPAVLALISLGLVPQASRMLRREAVELDGGGMLRAGGTAALLAGFALVTYLTATFAGFDASPEQLALGDQLAAGWALVAQSAWPAAVPAITATLLLACVFGVGASLVRLGWCLSAAQVAGALDTEPIAAPIRTPGRSILAGAAVSPNYGLQPGLPPVSPYDDTVTMPIRPPSIANDAPDDPWVSGLDERGNG